MRWTRSHRAGPPALNEQHGQTPQGWPAVRPKENRPQAPTRGSWRDESKGQERAGGPRAGRAAAQLAVARGADRGQANRADAGRAPAVCRVAGGGTHSEVHRGQSGVRPAGACSPSSELSATMLHPELEQTMPIVGGLISGEASAAAVASSSQASTRRPSQEALRRDCRLNMT